MKPPPAPAQYSQANEQQFRNQIEQNDLQTHKKGRHLDMGGADFHQIHYDTVTGARYKLTVVSGVLTLTAL